MPRTGTAEAYLAHYTAPQPASNRFTFGTTENGTVVSRSPGGTITLPAARSSAEFQSTEHQSIQALGRQLADEIGQVIIGKREVIELLGVALLCEGHILLEDVPGIGKTTLAKALAGCLNAEFRRIQFTPDLLPSDVTGIFYFNQRSGDFEFRSGPIHANVILADEINRATPRTQSSLLEAMEEHQVTVEGYTTPLPHPFLVVATQNPVELEGTFPLPEAQLDRFLLRLSIGYPSESEEAAILRRFGSTQARPQVRAFATAADVVRWVELARAVHVSDAVVGYIVALTRATRDHESIELGASPRATLALYRASQALAALRGRTYVIPDDVKYLVGPVLAHRLVLRHQGRLRGVAVDRVLRSIVESVPAPVEPVPGSSIGDRDAAAAPTFASAPPAPHP